MLLGKLQCRILKGLVLRRKTVDFIKYAKSSYISCDGQHLCYYVIIKMIRGLASSLGTKAYAARSQNVAKSHFTSTYHSDLTLSSIGLGTYIGDLSP
jgi:hypothetical protein